MARPTLPLLAVVACLAIVGCGPVLQQDKDAKAGCAEVTWLANPDNLVNAPSVVLEHGANAGYLLSKAANESSRYADLASAVQTMELRLTADGGKFVTDPAEVAVIEALNGSQGCGKWFS